MAHAIVSFHPQMPVAAFPDTDGVLILGDFDGNLLWQGAGHCHSALISADGGRVWADARIDECRLKVLLYNCRNGAVIAALDVPDELYQSHVTLSDIPHSRAVTMQLAAGQDGIAVHQLDYDGGAIRVSELFPGACYTTPAWKPDGTHFLTLEGAAHLL